MRLVICDDNLILGEALAAALQARGHQVLAITTSASDGAGAVGAHQPDGCILDLRFRQGESGLAAVREIRKGCAATRILILSGITDPVLWAQTMRTGVAGFLRKDQNVSQIAEALEVIAAGGVVFDPNVTRRVPVPRAGVPAGARYGLTPRERDVLARIAAGQSTSQMAAEMRITTGTLRSYVKSLLSKLSAHSRLQAAAIARREGLLRDAAAV